MSEGKSLSESTNCEKGITLNPQLVDLLSILDEKIPNDEQNKKINEYIENLRKMDQKYNEAKSKGTLEQVKFMIDTAIDSINYDSDKKDKLKQIFYDSFEDNTIFMQDKMKQKLMENGFDVSLDEIVLKQVNNIDFYAKEGILELTPDKLRNFYSHLFKENNVSEYQRMTIDNAGKYSQYVTKDGENFADEKLKKMLQFAERHNMKPKVNALIFYADYPKNLENALANQARADGLTDKEANQFVKGKIKEDLIGYVTNLAKNYGDKLERVDMFNELIYDPNMQEQGFKENETNGKKYHPRQNSGWQKYLNLNDLCDVALVARKLMPNVEFFYNDMNWTNSEKRKEMIDVVKKIKEIEGEYRKEGKLGKDEKGLIDAIGFEAHLTTSNTPEDIEQAYKDINNAFGNELPISITELDIARTGKQPESLPQVYKQNRLIEKISQMANEGKIKDLTIWSQSDQMSFLNEKMGRNAFASVILDSDCKEKKFEPTLDIIEKYKKNNETHSIGTISIENIIKNAITQGTGIEDVRKVENLEKANMRTNDKSKVNTDIEKG